MSSFLRVWTHTRLAVEPWNRKIAAHLLTELQADRREFDFISRFPLFAAVSSHHFNFFLLWNASILVWFLMCKYYLSTHFNRINTSDFICSVSAGAKIPHSLCVCCIKMCVTLLLQTVQPPSADGRCYSESENKVPELSSKSWAADQYWHSHLYFFPPSLFFCLPLWDALTKFLHPISQSEWW